MVASKLFHSNCRKGGSEKVVLGDKAGEVFAMKTFCEVEISV